MPPPPPTADVNPARSAALPSRASEHGVRLVPRRLPGGDAPPAVPDAGRDLPLAVGPLLRRPAGDLRPAVAAAAPQTPALSAAADGWESGEQPCRGVSGRAGTGT